MLAVGLPVLAWRRGEIDGVVCVGPLECMPNKLAESQLAHAGEAEGLPSLTLSLAGDPVDPAALDAFAFEVHARARARAGRGPGPAVSRNDRPEPAAVEWTGEATG